MGCLSVSNDSGQQENMLGHKRRFGLEQRCKMQFFVLLLILDIFCFQLMIDLSLSTPIQDASVYQFPLDLVSQLLQEVSVMKQELLAFRSPAEW